MPDLFIIQRDIYGNLTAKPKSLSKILAVLTGDVIPDSTPKIADLWYNEPNQSYSGFVYFVYSVQVQNYSVYINVYNKDSVFIGKSLKVTFPSSAGDINIPSFDPNNAGPYIDAGKDTAVSINDTIRLHPFACDSFGGIVNKWEWSINGGGFIQTSKGNTAIIAPADSNPNYKCVVRVTDNKGIAATDTIKIVICRDIPLANAGKDTTVYKNTTISLHAKGIDGFGQIMKMEWKVGNREYFTISSNDTIIIVPDTIGILPCILKVTDDDGNNGYDTAFIKLVGITYSDSGFYGYNILNPITTNFTSALNYSIAANLPQEGASLKVIIKRLTGSSVIGAGWSLSVFDNVGWRYSQYANDTQEFETTVNSGNVVRHIRFEGTGIGSIEIYENGATVPTGTKEITWN